jgi:hypothetical protein
MSERPVARILSVGLVVAALAGLAEASGVVASWAVVLGFALAVAGPPPVVALGALAGGGGLVALLLVAATHGLAGEGPLATALTVGGLVALTALLRLRLEARRPAWIALVGAGVVLAGLAAGDAPAVYAAAPALAGLALGLLPTLVVEVAIEARRRRGAPAAGDDHDPDPAAADAAGGTAGLTAPASPRSDRDRHA